jgi:hypothetical protein
MQKAHTQQLKQAFIAQAHASNKMITLAIFVKELEDDIEVAEWIASNYAHEYEQHLQLHMQNMLDAQLKLNAGHDAVIKTLLQHINELAGDDATQDVTSVAKHATDTLLSKFKLH